MNTILRLVPVVCICLTCCGWSKNLLPVKSMAGPSDCTTEPNGDKIWYPNQNPFYPEGHRILFESWPSICQGGKWVTDNETAAVLESIDRPKRELLHALRTRVLSTEELLLLNRHGSSILIQQGVPFRQSEIDAQYAALLKIQDFLRVDAQRDRSKAAEK